MAITTNETINFAEYTVERKKDASLTLKKVLFWFCYIGLPVVLLVVLILAMHGYEGYAIGGFLIVMVPLYFCNLLPKLVIPFTKIYYQVFYEYVIRQGEFSVSKIFGAEDTGAKGANKFRKRKPYLEPVKVSSMEIVAPYKDEYKKMIDEGQFDIKYMAYGDISCPDNYMCIFTDGNGKKCCCVFEMTNKMMKTMHTLNNEHVIKVDTLSR